MTNPFDIVGVVLDSLGLVFEVLDLGTVLNTIVAILRSSKSESTDLKEGLYSFKYYKIVRDALKPASCSI
jgi:hypothetical protein